MMKDESIDKNKNQDDEVYWKYFPKEALLSPSLSNSSFSDKDKFTLLFQEQGKWKLEDLKPYLDLKKNNDEAEIEVLLLKYTRRYKDDKGCVWCEAKHAI